MPFRKEQTLVVIKPDGIQRSLVGEIIKRFERLGLKLMAVKMFVPTPEFVEQHYTLDSEWRRKTGEKTIKNYKDKGLKPPSEDPYEITKIVLDNLKKYLGSGPVIAMVWQGMNAVKLVRKLVGDTEPLSSDVGTLRGDYVMDSYQICDIQGRAVRNLLHASGNVEEAKKEISHWFKPEEIINYRLIQEQILYDVDLNGILE